MNIAHRQCIIILIKHKNKNWSLADISYIERIKRAFSEVMSILLLFWRVKCFWLEWAKSCFAHVYTAYADIEGKFCQYQYKYDHVMCSCAQIPFLFYFKWFTMWRWRTYYSDMCGFFPKIFSIFIAVCWVLFWRCTLILIFSGYTSP